MVGSRGYIKTDNVFINTTILSPAPDELPKYFVLQEDFKATSNLLNRTNLSNTSPYSRNGQPKILEQQEVRGITHLYHLSMTDLLCSFSKDRIFRDDKSSSSRTPSPPQAPRRPETPQEHLESRLMRDFDLSRLGALRTIRNAPKNGLI